MRHIGLHGRGLRGLLSGGPLNHWHAHIAGAVPALLVVPIQNHPENMRHNQNKSGYRPTRGVYYQ